MRDAKENAPVGGPGHLDTSQKDRGDTGQKLVITGGGNSHRDAANDAMVNVPLQLREADRWMLWRGKKIPFRASAPTQRASSTKPATWSSFAAANDAYAPDRDGGLGFALGDGFACVDIDHCEADNEAALFLLETVGCYYIEVSPSGDGLHGWARSHARLPRCKGTLDGLHVEVYNAGRYMTVTGRSIVCEPVEVVDGVLRLSLALQREAGARQGQTRAEDTQTYPDTYRHNQTQPEDNIRGTPKPNPENFLPATVGLRHQTLFQWTRQIKTVCPEATVAERIGFAKQWHRAALPFIGTKGEQETIKDFLNGWDNAYPFGLDMDAVLTEARQVVVPELVNDALGEHALVYQICVVLQRLAGDKPFFIASRKLGECIGVCRKVAARDMNILHLCGVLILAEAHTTTKAARYYVAPEYMPESA